MSASGAQREWINCITPEFTIATGVITATRTSPADSRHQYGGGMLSRSNRKERLTFCVICVACDWSRYPAFVTTIRAGPPGMPASL